MDFGSLDGLVNATEKVVYDSGELAAAVTSITISGLDGDVDEEYTLYARIVNGYDGAASHYIILNNDNTAAHYGYQSLSGTDATAAATRGTSSAILLGVTAALGDVTQGYSTLYAKSGSVRTLINKHARSISTTTVTAVYLMGNSWNNTVDNITRIDILADQASGIGIGSRIILMKKVTTTTGMRTGIMNIGQPLINATVNRSCVLKGMWQTIYKNTLASAATTLDITGLDGNTDTMYRLRVRAINGAAGAGGCYLRINNDSGASNYGYQFVAGTGAAATAYRTPPISVMYIGSYGVTGTIINSDMLIYAKSGYVRTAINETTMDIATTVVTSIVLYGDVWNNTSDNITSLVVGLSQTNGLGIGTEIELERLIP